MKRRNNMIDSYSSTSFFLLTIALLFSTSNFSNTFASLTQNSCLPDQRDTLLKFKSEFKIRNPDHDFLNIYGYPKDISCYPKTKSWGNSSDCCYWDGITCDAKSGKLSKPPTFFTEIEPQPGKHSRWTETDQDFTLNQSASICRRHTLQFSHGVLQKNLEKIQSGDSFWSELVKISFPRLQDPYFDNGGGNNNLAHQSQGLGHVGVGHGNFNMAIQFGVNDGRQTNASAGEVPYPPLNLTLTITPELISSIESVLNTEERNSMSGYGKNNNNLYVNRGRIHQGSGIEEGSFNMATQFGANDGSQINTYFQSPNIVNQFLGPQGMNEDSLNNNSNLDIDRGLTSRFWHQNAYQG